MRARNVYGVWPKKWTERVFREGRDRSRRCAGRAAPSQTLHARPRQLCKVSFRVSIHPRVGAHFIPWAAHEQLMPHCGGRDCEKQDAHELPWPQPPRREVSEQLPCSTHVPRTLSRPVTAPVSPGWSRRQRDHSMETVDVVGSKHHVRAPHHSSSTSMLHERFTVVTPCYELHVVCVGPSGCAYGEP